MCNLPSSYAQIHKPRGLPGPLLPEIAEDKMHETAIWQVAKSIVCWCLLLRPSAELGAQNQCESDGNRAGGLTYV